MQKHLYAQESFVLHSMDGVKAKQEYRSPKYLLDAGLSQCWGGSTYLKYDKSGVNLAKAKPSDDKVVIGYDPSTGLPFQIVADGFLGADDSIRKKLFKFIDEHITPLINVYTAKLSKVGSSLPSKAILKELITNIRESFLTVKSQLPGFTLGIAITYEKGEQTRVAGFGIGDIGFIHRKKGEKAVTQLAFPRKFGGVKDAFDEHSTEENKWPIVRDRCDYFDVEVQSGDEVVGYTHLFKGIQDSEKTKKEETKKEDTKKFLGKNFLAEIKSLPEKTSLFDTAVELNKHKCEEKKIEIEDRSSDEDTTTGDDSSIGGTQIPDEEQRLSIKINIAQEKLITLLLSGDNHNSKKDNPHPKKSVKSFFIPNSYRLQYNNKVYEFPSAELKAEQNYLISFIVHKNKQLLQQGLQGIKQNNPLHKVDFLTDISHQDHPDKISRFTPEQQSELGKICLMIQQILASNTLDFTIDHVLKELKIETKDLFSRQAYNKLASYKEQPEVSSKPSKPLLLNTIDELQQRCLLGMALQSQAKKIQDQFPSVKSSMESLQKDLKTEFASSWKTLTAKWLNSDFDNRHGILKTNVGLFVGKRGQAGQLIKSFASATSLPNAGVAENRFSQLKQGIITSLNSICEKTVVFGKDIFKAKQTILRTLIKNLILAQNIKQLNGSLTALNGTQKETLAQKRGLLGLFSSNTKSSRSLTVLEGINDRIKEFESQAPSA